MSTKRLPDNQIAVYQTPDGSVNIEVLYAHENVWLSQKRMAELFDCSADNISLHLKNIYSERELDAAATTEEFSVVQQEGQRQVARQVTCHSLEAIIAKNYLDRRELDHLNRIVTMYLDYAELQAVRRQPMFMKDWIEKLNAFLKFSEHEILTNAGSISHEVAQALALKRFDDLKSSQDLEYVSDFDAFLKQLPKNDGKS